MSNNLTKEVRWFMDILKKEFAVEVSAEEIGVEATELGIDEVEDFIVPKELFENLPESIVYEIMIVEDEKKNVWVGAIAFYPNSPEWCIQAITKNGVIETFFLSFTKSFM